MTPHEISARIREYVTENFLYMRRGYDFADTDSLLDHGIVDPTAVGELIAFVQSEFSVQLDEAEITEENFGSLEAIARLVLCKSKENLAA